MFMRLESNPGTMDGTGAETAFGTLANGTRLAILEALYDALRSHDGPGQPGVPYTELRERVGVKDSGKFNYHLSELTDGFVVKRDGGYVLRQTGRTAVQIVLRSFDVDDPGFGPTRVDADCPRCGGGVTVQYGQGHLTTRCVDCPGLLAATGLPDGTISRLPFPPAGAATRDPTALLDPAHRRLEQQCRSMTDGVCPRCGGETTARLLVCGDHEPEGVCRECGTTLPAVAELGCLTCGHERLAPPAFARTDTRAVWEAVTTVLLDDAHAWDRFETTARWSQTLTRTDSTRVVVAPPTGTRLVIDDQLAVTREE